MCVSEFIEKLYILFVLYVFVSTLYVHSSSNDCHHDMHTFVLFRFAFVYISNISLPPIVAGDVYDFLCWSNHEVYY